jgi:dCMP deaminase
MPRQANNWDHKFMGLAEHISGWSKDPSTKVGCVIVGSSQEVRALGYNGFPRNIDDNIQERYERPAKYFWTEHAERNAIFNAASTGVPLKDCTAYTTLFPCVDCARAMVQSGIKTVVVYEPNWDDQTWKFGEVRDLLEEAGMEIVCMEKE